MIFLKTGKEYLIIAHGNMCKNAMDANTLSSLLIIIDLKEYLIVALFLTWVMQ